MEMWSTALARKKEKIPPRGSGYGILRARRKREKDLPGPDRLRANPLPFSNWRRATLPAGLRDAMKDMGLKSLGQSALDARSHALAGNLLALLKWWLDRGAKESPKAMD